MNPTPRSLLARVAEALMALSLLGMVLAVFGNVLLRYFWGTGWAVSEELSRLLFIWLVSLGAILAFADGQHLGFDLVTARLRGRWLQASRWLTHALVAVALGYLVVGAWQQVQVGLDSRSPVMGYPLALAAGGIAVMGLCMAWVLLAQCWAELRGQAPRTAPAQRD